MFNAITIRSLGILLTNVTRCRHKKNDRGQLDKGRRLAASVQQENTGMEFTAGHPSGHHPLTTEHYNQLLCFVNKQNMEITHSEDNTQAGFLAGKSFCFLTANLGLRWIIDSGATDHITPHLHLFHSYTVITKACFITMPNGKHVQVKHIGTIVLSPSITLQEVLHVPDFQLNLLSAIKLAKQLSADIVFSPTSCYIQGHLKSKLLVLGK